jgi:hypothetical protein
VESLQFSSSTPFKKKKKKKAMREMLTARL